MAPDKRSSARRKQNVIAAKKSYEQKKEERSSLHKKNEMLVDLQKELLREKARLQEEASFWENAFKNIQHTCEPDFHLETEHPSRHIAAYIDMTEEEGGQSLDHRGECRGATYQQDCDDSIALDLSLKKGRARGDSAALVAEPQRLEAHAPQRLEESTPQRPEAHAPQRYEPAEIDFSTLDLGATQEVELKVRRNRKSKRVTFDDSRNSMKKIPNDIFTPPMCTTVH